MPILGILVLYINFAILTFCKYTLNTSRIRNLIMNHFIKKLNLTGTNFHASLDWRFVYFYLVYNTYYIYKD